jgi:hypothetical protein
MTSELRSFVGILFESVKISFEKNFSIEVKMDLLDDVHRLFSERHPIGVEGCVLRSFVLCLRMCVLSEEKKAGREFFIRHSSSLTLL